jgi:hypothetical protein
MPSTMSTFDIFNRQEDTGLCDHLSVDDDIYSDEEYDPGNPSTISFSNSSTAFVLSSKNLYANSHVGSPLQTFSNLRRENKLVAPLAWAKLKNLSIYSTPGPLSHEETKLIVFIDIGIQSLLNHLSWSEGMRLDNILMSERLEFYVDPTDDNK